MYAIREVRWIAQIKRASPLQSEISEKQTSRSFLFAFPGKYNKSDGGQVAATQDDSQQSRVGKTDQASL